MTMPKVLAVLLFLVAMLATIPSAHAGGNKPPPQSPGARTRAFLDAYGHDVALQDMKRIDKMRPFFSKDLQAALKAARIKQETFAAAHPGDKPGLVEIGFTSGEGNDFDSYTIGLNNTVAKDRVAVDVAFVNSEQETAVQWKDRYEWVLEGKTWKLDDIVFRSEGRPGPRARRFKALLRSH
jgi:hypothetical protein